MSVGEVQTFGTRDGLVTSGSDTEVTKSPSPGRVGVGLDSGPKDEWEGREVYMSGAGVGGRRGEGVPWMQDVLLSKGEEEGYRRPDVIDLLRGFHTPLDPGTGVEGRRTNGSG